MHIYLVHGVAHAEINCILSRMVALKIPSTELRDFCDSMQFPKADAWKKKEVMGMFTSKKISPGDFKPAASTCLCLYPLLRLFFMSKPGILKDDRGGQILSQPVCCAGLSRPWKLGRDTAATEVASSGPQAHCEQFVKTYGEDPVTPKFHMTMHLPLMLKRFQLLVKRIADQPISFMLAFESSVAHEIWRSRSHFHKVFGIFDADVHPRARSARSGRAHASHDRMWFCWKARSWGSCGSASA